MHLECRIVSSQKYVIGCSHISTRSSQGNITQAPLRIVLTVDVTSTVDVANAMSAWLTLSKTSCQTVEVEKKMHDAYGRYLEYGRRGGGKTHIISACGE
jgi:hypothetical protein